MRHHRTLILGLLALCGNAVAAESSALDATASASLRQNLLRQEYFASTNRVGLQAPNRALGIRTYFEDDGLRVVRRDATEAELFRWRAQALRRGGETSQLGTGVASAHEAQVELRQGPVTQTFDNAGDGLRAALRIDAAPRGAAPLDVAIDLGAARASASGAHDVQIVAGDGSTFRTTLSASDGTGRALALTPQVSTSGALTLRIDDAGAAYPITVNTVVTTNFDIRIESDQVSAHFATSVAAIGDINLDGIGDFAVGAPDWDGGQGNEGAVFIYYGNPLWATAQWILFAGTADKRLEIDQDSARFGASVAAVGDVNRDNVMDLVIGAPRFDNGQFNEGAAFVYSGFDILFSTPVLPAGQLEANRGSAEMGAAVAGAGDTDGDGYDDVLVGAPGFVLGTTLGGRAFLYRGGPGVTFDATADVVYSSDVDGDRLGASVAGAGDTNGDGRADVLVGAPGGAWVELHRGGSDAPQDTVRLDFNTLPGTDSSTFGTAVAGAGDVNGDGYADFVVGQPGYGNGQAGEGAVYLYFGGAPFNTAPDAIIQSNLAGAGLGESLAGGGDVNGDGYADIVAGAPHYTQGESNEGRVLVYFGRAGAFSTTPAAELQINQVDAVFGSSVAMGDVDGDGYDEVFGGAPYADYGHSDEGALFVYRGGGGKLDSTFDTGLGGIGGGGQAADYFGFSVDGAGDVNRDGYDDVIVGAPLFDGGETDEGRAFVYLGSAAGLAATPWRTLEVNQVGAHFGHSVAGAGDVNGDGFADVVIGAPFFDDGETDEGTAFVYFGGFSMNLVADARYESNFTDARLGWSVAGAGDVNGDGFADVIAGAPNWGASQTGEALLFFGNTGQLDTVADGVLKGGQTNGDFGASVAGAGDVNGDGYGDVIVGAPRLDTTLGGSLANNVGRVSLYLGGAGDFDAQNDLLLFGDQADAQFGYSIAGAGDVDGDGFDDIVVGAPYQDTSQVDAGRALVYYGDRTAPLTRSVTLSVTAQANGRSGFAVDGAGDLNRDGYADLVISAPLFDNGGVDSGWVKLLYGAAGGIGAQSDITLPLAGANLGSAVGGAGDINGDGFADVVLGAPFVQTTVFQPGIVRAYLGGDLPGRDLKLRQLLDGSVPIQPWGSAGNLSGYTVTAQGASPRGRELVRLEMQACPAGVDFYSAADGCRGGESSGWSDTGLAGIALAADFGAPLAAHTLYHWRARLVYAPAAANVGGSQAAVVRTRGPWLYFRAQADNADVRIVPLASDTIFFDDFE